MKIIEYEDKYLEDVKDLLIELEEYILTIDKDHLDQLHPDYRDKKVGSRLLRRFFEEGKDTKRQLFWVIRTNENAIKRYKHYGFNEENMFDFVMQYN